MSSPIFYAPSQLSKDFPTNPLYPPTEKLLGSWHITHTTSPVWKDKRNVVVTYTALPSKSHSARPQLDDLITYQTLESRKSQTMHGTDTPSAAGLGSWTWRGNGWLKFVTSQWEILGYEALEREGKEGSWLVVLAQKSLFTPAVLNVCTRGKDGLESERLEAVKVALKGLEHEELKVLVDGLYEVSHN